MNLSDEEFKHILETVQKSGIPLYKIRAFADQLFTHKIGLQAMRDELKERAQNKPEVNTSTYRT